MRYRSEAIEVACRRQVAAYRIMTEGEQQQPLPPCTMTDEDIECWLYLWLKNRRFLLSDFVRHSAREMGISAVRLRKARKQLGIVAWRWEDEIDHPGYWFWELPM